MVKSKKSTKSLHPNGGTLVHKVIPSTVQVILLCVCTYIYSGSDCIRRTFCYYSNRIQYMYTARSYSGPVDNPVYNRQSSLV